MSGSGPLGRSPAGTFNFEPPPPGRALYFDPCFKRVRAVVGGETIADSRELMLLQESGHQPVYYFPRVLLHDPRRRQGDQGRGLVLPRAAGRGRADQGPDRLLLALDGPLV
jgi:hypothetical protein